jgi:predicted dehydrogenase
MTVAALRFENGALGTLFTTTCSKPEGAQRLYLHGTEGSFCYHGGRLERYAMGPEDERERMMGAFGPGQGGGGDAASADPMAVDADGHTLIIEDFVLAVKEGRDPLIPIASAKHAVEIACAVFEACRRGATVHIKDIRA